MARAFAKAEQARAGQHGMGLTRADHRRVASASLRGSPTHRVHWAYAAGGGRASSTHAMLPAWPGLCDGRAAMQEAVCGLGESGGAAAVQVQGEFRVRVQGASSMHSSLQPAWAFAMVSQRGSPTRLGNVRTTRPEGSCKYESEGLSRRVHLHRSSSLAGSCS